MRAPLFHLLTTSPAELAELWAAQAHELRMAPLSKPKRKAAKKKPET